MRKQRQMESKLLFNKFTASFKEILSVLIMLQDLKYRDIQLMDAKSERNFIELT